MALLREDANKPKRGGGSHTKRDPTEVRELGTWMKLNHRIKVEGCENPECIDPRPKDTDAGVQIVVEVKGQFICRYCFLNNYLSND